MPKTEAITKQKFESVKRYLEKGGGGGGIEDDKKGEGISMLPVSLRFFEHFISQGVCVDLIDHGRLICSITVHPGLVNAVNFLHGGATAMLVDLLGSAVLNTVGVSMDRVSVEINVSYLDAAYAGEEIEIEAKVLGVGKAVCVASVEFRKKNTGKIIAQGRHTLYLTVRSKI